VDRLRILYVASLSRHDEGSLVHRHDLHELWSGAHSAGGSRPGASLWWRDDNGGSVVASSNKRQTTMAKVAREQALRERRSRKKERKDARKQEAAQDPSGAAHTSTNDESE
jgi:hypothetical protein